MAAIIFEIPEFADRLISAGVPEKQAKAQTEAFAKAFSSAEQGLATKGDITQLRSEMRKMEHRLENRLTLRMIGLALWK